MIILDERLNAVNDLWGQLQQRAASRKSDLENFVKHRGHGAKRIPQSVILSFRENFSLLWSLYLSNEKDSVDEGEESNEELVDNLENGIDDDDNFVTQMELHELLDGVASIEETLVSEEIVDGDMAVLKQQLERIQVKLNNI
jgi:hypothetical protein